MRQKTVAEMRALYNERLAKRSANYEKDPAGTLARAKKTMNSFYRLAGYSERLFYIQNDERLYKRYEGRRLEKMENRENAWIDRARDYLKEFNADVNYCGLYPSIIDIVKTESGGVVDLFLTAWYPDREND